MNLPLPRKFQQFALDAIAKSNCQKSIIYAPTGAGKAILLMYLAEKYLKQHKRVLLLVDRIVLTQQLSKTATQYELQHNMIQGNNTKLSTSYPQVVDNSLSIFTIASIQSFFSRGVQLNYDVVLVDECHTMYAKQIGYIQAHKGRVIGVSATPFTIGLGNVYEEVINATTTQQLTSMKLLSPLEVLTFQKINMVNAKTIAGEWAGQEVEHRSADILGNVVEGYIRNAGNKRAICFGATIKHCNELKAQFDAKNISCAVYTSKSTSAERDMMIKQFDKSEIMVLISVACLSKGFDKSYVECIIDVRPLRRGFAEYIQMVGRGLRISDNKDKCILLDFTGNFLRFLPEYEELYHEGVVNLNMEHRLQSIRKNRENVKIHHCPNCKASPFHKNCIRCGYESLQTRAITTDTENILQLPVKIFARDGIMGKISHIFSSLFF